MKYIYKILFIVLVSTSVNAQNGHPNSPQACQNIANLVYSLLEVVPQNPLTVAVGYYYNGPFDPGRLVITANDHNFMGLGGNNEAITNADRNAVLNIVTAIRNQYGGFYNIFIGAGANPTWNRETYIGNNTTRITHPNRQIVATQGHTIHAEMAALEVFRYLNINPSQIHMAANRPYCVLCYVSLGAAGANLLENNVNYNPSDTYVRWIPPVTDEAGEQVWESYTNAAVQNLNNLANNNNNLRNRINNLGGLYAFIQRLLHIFNPTDYRDTCNR